MFLPQVPEFHLPKALTSRCERSWLMTTPLPTKAIPRMWKASAAATTGRFPLVGTLAALRRGIPMLARGASGVDAVATPRNVGWISGVARSARALASRRSMGGAFGVDRVVGTAQRVAPGEREALWACYVGSIRLAVQRGNCAATATAANGGRRSPDVHVPRDC